MIWLGERDDSRIVQITSNAFDNLKAERWNSGFGFGLFFGLIFGAMVAALASQLFMAVK